MYRLYNSIAEIAEIVEVVEIDTTCKDLNLKSAVAVEEDKIEKDWSIESKSVTPDSLLVAVLDKDWCTEVEIVVVDTEDKKMMKMKTTKR